MNSSLMTVLVSSPDIYREVFDVFIELVNENWPDCKHDIVLANNELPCEDPKVHVINCGADAMSACLRMIQAIEQTDSKYYLLITEDNLIVDPIDSKMIDDILETMMKYDLGFYKIIPKPKPTGKLFHGVPHCHEISMQQPYGRNLNTAIWERDYLLEHLGDGSESGWDLEEKWLYEASLAEDIPYDRCVADDRNVMNAVHGIVQGKWMPSALKELKRKGYAIDTGERGIIPWHVERDFLFRERLNSIISPKLRVNVKRILSKVGVKFVTRY